MNPEQIASRIMDAPWNADPRVLRERILAALVQKEDEIRYLVVAMQGAAIRTNDPELNAALSKWRRDRIASVSTAALGEHHE